MILTKTELVILIREAIEQQLTERKFNPDVLSKMNFPNQEAMINYVSDRMKLKPLGGGSSRMAYLVDSKRVLKIATNEAGFAQNEAEIEAYSNHSMRPIITNIFRSDPDYKWLLAELVRPLSSEDEFSELTGVPWLLFTDVIGAKRGDYEGRMKMIRAAVISDHFMYQSYTVEMIDELFAAPFLASVIRGLRAMDEKLVPADLKKVDHWGKTPDQRVVLLDYGYTYRVKQNHY